MILDDDNLITLRARIDVMLETGKKNPELIKQLETKVAIYPATDENVRRIIKRWIFGLGGRKKSLNWLDMSKIEITHRRFYNWFYKTQYSGNISKWNISSEIQKLYYLPAKCFESIY